MCCRYGSWNVCNTKELGTYVGYSSSVLVMALSKVMSDFLPCFQDHKIRLMVQRSKLYTKFFVETLVWLFSLTFLLSVDLHPQWWLPDVWQNFFGLLPFPGWCRYPVTLSTFKEFHLKVWHALRSITAWFFIICSHPAEITKIDPESESSHF